MLLETMTEWTHAHRMSKMMMMAIAVLMALAACHEELPFTPCDPTACIEGDDVVNCDSACGEVHAFCSAVCVGSDQAGWLGPGPTVLKLPPLSTLEQHCDDGCNGPQTPTLALGLPPTAECVTIDGPEGLRFKVVEEANRRPICDLSDFEEQCGLVTIPEEIEFPRLVLAFEGDEVVHGAQVIIYPRTAPCGEPACAGVCDGEPYNSTL